jgi:hypothetical protein
LNSCVEIANTSIDGNRVTLFVDNKPVESKLAWARAGRRYKVEFSLTSDKPGQRKIRVGDRTSTVTFQ